MKRYWTAALAVALLSACAPRAGASTFLPVISGPELDAKVSEEASGLPLAGSFRPKPSKVRMGVLATVWEMPDVSIAATTGYAGDRVEFEPQVMPLVELDYRLSQDWGLGGWYNPLTVDYRIKGPTADLLTGGANPRLADSRLATGSLNMWNLHVTHFLPRNVAIEAAVAGYHGAINAVVPDPRQNGYINVNAAQGGTEVQVWGYKSYRIWGYAQRPAYLTGGLGMRRRLSRESGNTEPPTTAHASLAFSYYPRDTVSLNVAGWFTDLNNSDTFTTRLTAGVTGHF